MGTKAKDTQARIDRLLRAIGRACNHEMYPASDLENAVVLSAVLDDRKVYESYCEEGTLAQSLVEGDLLLLAQAEYVQTHGYTGPHGSYDQPGMNRLDHWQAWLQPEGLKRLEEIEKPYWRRLHDRGPGAFWLILVSLLSLLVAVVALIRTF